MICTNIFPGDILLKNFGLTDHNRVIFYDYDYDYDYDEVQYLTDMNFRVFPKPDNYHDYLLNNISLSVAPQNAFPEQIITFVTANYEVRKSLESQHPELLDINYCKNA